MGSTDFEIPQNTTAAAALAEAQERAKLHHRLKQLTRILDEEKHKAFQQLCRMVRVQEESCFADYSVEIEEHLKRLIDKEGKGGK